MTTAASVEVRQLYGGAISTALPSNFQDVSVFREVPDHQEVFVDKTGADHSVIVEILQLETETKDQGVAEYYFNDLAEANFCTEGKILVSTKFLAPELLPCFAPEVIKESSVCLGLQVVGKFNQQQQKERVLVYVAVVRIESISTDLVVHMNVPLSSNVTTHELDLTSALTENSNAPGSKIFLSLLQSLKVNDWSLFG